MFNLNKYDLINMNKLNFLFRFVLAWAVIGLSAYKASAQCTITGKADGCVDVSENFSISGPDVSTSDSIVWTFSNGTLKKLNGDGSAGNVWSAPTGGSSPIVAIIYKGGVAKCTATSTIAIHLNPIPDFKLLSDPIQCYNGNAYEYEDLTSTPSGNPIVKREFDLGANNFQFDSIVIPPTVGPMYIEHPLAAGGPLDASIRVVDSKGCIGLLTKTAFITIKPDLGVDFTTPVPTACDSTPTTFVNNSLISQLDAKSFRWIFGDTVGQDTINWPTVKYTYRKNGCFNASLIVESNDGCADTMTKKAACTIKPILGVTVENGDIQCAGNQNFIFKHPVIQGAKFLWTFDDPPTGPDNTDDKNWISTHEFSSAGPYDVSFQLTTPSGPGVPSCSFNTIYRVHVKGPSAGIESKPAGIFIPPSQRYQCKIKDTVYFTNVSSYYLNDDSAFNDFYYTVGGGAILQLVDNNSFHVDFDTISRNTGSSQTITTKTGRNVYVSPLGDTIKVGNQVLVFDGNILATGASDKDKFYTKNSHTTRIWDFADNFAPQCTTDSRPIYPKAAKYGNLHWPTSPAPANTYDANGKWINCNFNRDSLPKHWYTPGQERCYTVRLTLTDTSKKDPKIQSLTPSHNDPSKPDSTCESVGTVQLALQGPDARGLRWTGIPCYGPPNVYGFMYNFSRTGPACDRQAFWIHFDSLADRVDGTPGVFDKWVPQTGTVVDRNFTPWPLATLSLPPNVGQIFWQYQPNGAYPSKIADPAGWVTLGFRVQNGIDPLTGQPCIDERWYDSAYRYIQSNPGFRFHNSVKDSSYTFERICSPNDVTVKRDSTFLPTINGYTFSSDSIGAEIWNWGDGEIEIDSFIRYNPIGGLLYSYRLRWKLEGNNPPVLIDSILTRIYDPVLGKTTFLDARDSTPDIFRTHRFKKPNWNRVSHTLVPCQLVPLDSLGFTVYRKSCCDNPPFENVRVAISGFLSYLNSSEEIVCRNTPIQFFDSARYYLEFPIPVPPYIIDEWDYWADPTVAPPPTGGVRPKPNPGQYEALRWNFGDGTGWNSSVPPDPIRSFSEPGVYNVQLEYTDSVGCKQIESKKIIVTGLSANFSFDPSLTGCKPTVIFTDSTLMLDPCVLVNGTPCDNPVGNWWDFGDNKPNAGSLAINQPKPPHIYTSFGDFDVWLKVKTQLGCEDSIMRTISLEGPRPRFEFAADSVGCAPFTLEIRNTSINPSSGADWITTTYDVDAPNDTTKRQIVQTGHRDSAIRIVYDKPGTYEVIMLQSDSTKVGASSGKCGAIYPDTTSTFGQYRKFIVRVLPTRGVSFTLSDSIVCVGDLVSYTSTSDTIYSNYRWITGMGDTIVKPDAPVDSASRVYDKPGTFYVQLRPTYTPPPGEPACPAAAVRKIEVKDVNAKFTGCEDSSTIPLMRFKNQSTNYQKWWWDFGVNNGFEDGSIRPEQPDANYNYGENRGVYTVVLVVESPEGCRDTAGCTFTYEYKTDINPPNVFTPGDGNTLNDVFDVIVLNEEMYDLGIYNRWGEKVFEATDKDAQWNGKHYKTDMDCPTGVYYVIIKYRLRGSTDKIYRGTLSLIRKK
ncbi:MAG TPA: PKD domain-containing protein [Bacteroidia bacterium]|nr:PKD domain-containing protein [Bacteroidia bacterium]